MRPQKRNDVDVVQLINTNPRAAEIHDLLTDAVYMAQVPSFAKAVEYAQEVSYHAFNGINLQNLTWDEARPIFNYVVKSHAQGKTKARF